MHRAVLDTFANVFLSKVEQVVGSRPGDACASSTCDLRNKYLGDAHYQCIHCGSKMHAQCAEERARLLERKLVSSQDVYYSICPNAQCPARVINSGEKLAEVIQSTSSGTEVRSSTRDAQSKADLATSTSRKVVNLANTLDVFASTGDIDFDICVDSGDASLIPKGARFTNICIPSSAELSHRMGARVVAVQVCVVFEVKPGANTASTTSFSRGILKNVYHIVHETRRTLLLPRVKNSAWDVYKDPNDLKRSPRNFFFHEAGLGKVDPYSSGIGKMIQAQSNHVQESSVTPIDPEYTAPYQVGDSIESNSNAFDAKGTDICIYVPGADEVRSIITQTDDSKETKQPSPMGIDNLMDFRVRCRICVLLEKPETEQKETGRWEHSVRHSYWVSSAVELDSVPPKGTISEQGIKTPLVPVSRFMEPAVEGTSHGIQARPDRIVCDHIPYQILRSCRVPRNALKELFASDPSIENRNPPPAEASASIRSGTRLFPELGVPCKICKRTHVDPIESMADPNRVQAALHRARLPKGWTVHAYCWLRFIRSLQSKPADESELSDSDEDGQIYTFRKDRVHIPESIQEGWFRDMLSQDLVNKLRNGSNCQQCYLRKPRSSKTGVSSERICSKCTSLNI